MNQQHIAQELASMAETSGVIACALVEISTGMVYASAGKHPGIDCLAEAASDYWRLYKRIQANFDDFGPLEAVSAQHKRGVMSLIPCSEGLVVATVSLPSKLDWRVWSAKVKVLGALLK